MSGNHSGSDDKWTIAFPALETPESKIKTNDSTQQEHVRPFQLFSRSGSTQSSPNGSWEPIPPASPLPERLPTSLDVNVAPFSPSNTVKSFDPFDSKDEDYDDVDLSEHLLSTNLLDDFDADVTSTLKSSVTTPVTNFNGTAQSPWFSKNSSASWYTSTHGQPEMESSVRNIWENENQTRDEWWNRFEPYSYEDENEFDPTLQYYHGHLLDAETIQDMNRLSLSVTNPSLEESQAENVGEDMSSLQMLESIFTDVSQADLVEALEQHDYDLDRAIEALLSRKKPASAQSSATNAQPSPPNSTTESTPKKRQVCRHFLAGECYRKDCWFAHDLQVKVCKFWLQGSCLKGDYCEFSHHIDVQEVASKISNPSPTTPSQKQQPLRFDESEYPDLSASKKVPRNVPPKETNPVTTEDFPDLATAAKIKSPPASNKKPAINFAAAAKKKGTGKVTNKQAPKKGTPAIEPRLLQKLKQPVRIPWLETGSALNTQYLQQREQAIKYGMLRNRFFSRATAYYMKGDGAKAKAYSNEAKYYNQLIQQMHNEASRRIFEQRNQNEAFIDLHGLHVDEALSMIQERFEALKSYEGIVYIVTGTGHHSGSLGLSKKQSKLKPSVEEFLRRENYKFAETSIVGDNKGGVFAVILQPSR